MAYIGLRSQAQKCHTVNVDDVGDDDVAAVVICCVDGVVSQNDEEEELTDRVWAKRRSTAKETTWV